MDRSDDYTRLAHFFLENDEPEGAGYAAELALHTGGTTDAWVALATARARQKRYAEASRAYERALAQRPDDVAAWTDLGECFVYLMDLPRAAAAFGRALDLDPHGENPWGRRARALVARVLKQLRVQGGGS